MRGADKTPNQPSDPRQDQPTGLKRLVREPLLQFMVLGALIFVASGLIGRSDSATKSQIIVDDALVGRMAALYEKQMGTMPDDVQLKTLVDNYVEEEVLYREALRLNLDQQDEIVRRRLVQKMRFLAARSFDDPTDDDLRAFYDSHQKDFEEPARVSFRHLYFSPDKDGADAAKARAEAALQLLNADCEVVEGTTESDPFPLQMDYASLGPLDAVQLFGNTQMADALFAEKPGGWTGPFASGYGWHLVYVSDRVPAHVPPFEEVEDKVRRAYEQDSSERQTREAIEAMAAKYDILREDTELPQ